MLSLIIIHLKNVTGQYFILITVKNIVFKLKEKVFFPPHKVDRLSDTHLLIISFILLIHV